jgi:MoxR-like ATPase
MEKKNNVIERMVSNIEKVIVGKRDTIELLCLALLCDGHVLIEDVPGTGKTTLALALSKTIGGEFKRISCTPDVMPSDITGFSMFNPKTNEFEYREGAIMANIFLADEINRTPPKTQSGLLEAMEEKKVTVDGKLYPLPKPFMVIATQNPIEHLGTYPLPEAQLDRFIMKISLGYPSEEEELGILSIYGQKTPLEHLEAVVTLDEILEVQEEILQVKINEKVSQYIIKIAQESRKSNQIQLGISPRGTLAIARAARAWAYYQNRDFVTPDDIKKVLMPIVGHRIIPRAEAKYENISLEDILTELLKRVTVPE